MPKVATRYLETDPWAIVEKGFHPERQQVSESIFSLGNEYMGVRGYFEEGYSGPSMVGSYLNGVFEEDDIHHPFTFKGMATRMTFLVNTVDWLYTRITLDGETLDLARSKVSSFSRRLDLRTGTLTREFIWHVGQKKLKVRFLRFLSMATPHFGGQRIAFEPLNFSGPVEVVSGLDFGILQYSTNTNLWRTLQRAQAGGTFAILAATRRSGHRVFSAFALHSETPLLDARLVDRQQFIGQEFTLDLCQGNVCGFDKLVVNHGERDVLADTDAVWSDGLARAKEAFATTFDAALADHAAYWDHAWRTIDVRIEGDAENEQGIRYCIFQLHQTYHGVDPSLNISAKGLTGESYWGATWWDTETYCLPFYLFNNPQAARNLLGYRHATLPGAKARAKQLDCVGARYPMATIDGSEIVGVWQHGDLEIHVSAAVGYGIWHYTHVAGDKEFLYDRGIEMLLEISRYYASRGQYSPSGEFGFWFVMGADEFHMGVHNNTYTNVMAKKCFQWALETVAEMRKKAPKQLQRVIKRTRLTDAELRDWRRKARDMRVLQDARTGLIEQHDGYFDLPHLDLSKVPPTDFPLYHHWAYVRIFRWDMTKQPDALLLPFFFSHEYSEKEKRVNFEYYEPRCSHESSLSPGIHSIIAAELGLHQKAYDYSLHAARLDLDDYNRNTHEGLHTTSMAAAWLLLVYGFGGLRSDGPVLAFQPSLPKKWKSYSFRILHRGSVLGLTVDKKSVTFQIHDGPDLSIEVFGTRHSVDRDGLTLPLPTNRRG